MTGSSRWQSIPNIITTVRIVGSPSLVLLAYFDRPWLLAGQAAFLVFTELIDGYIARRLNAASALGARLDTIADAVFYSCLLAAVVVLRPQLVLGETIWILAAVGSYLLSWLASFHKFGRLPSYHTWAAKGVWVVVGAGVVCLLGDIHAWPFRAAMICVFLTNIEACLITYTLPECKVDVPTLWHARQVTKADLANESADKDAANRDVAKSVAAKKATAEDENNAGQDGSSPSVPN